MDEGLRARRDAVVIGIDAYADQPLRGCVNDATEIAACLSLEQYDFNTETLFNGQATRSRVMETLGRLAYGHGVGGTLLVYFAGHGTVLGDAGHLVTVDGSEWDPGVSLAQLAHLMEAASAHYAEVVVVLDCCHAGAGSTWINQRPLTSTYLDREIPSVNASRVLLAACRAWETAGEQMSDTGVHGEFTKALLDGMLGDAVDFEGTVSVLGLHEFISRALDSSEQVPVMKGDLSGSVVLGTGFEPRRGAPIAAAELKQIIAKAAMFADRLRQAQVRELGDLTNRRRGGLERVTTVLEETIRWFDSTRQSLPDVLRDARWRASWETVVNAQAMLGDLGVGDTLRLGSVISRIGAGGFGNVWQLRTNDGQSIALKVFHGNELHDTIKPVRFRNGYFSMKSLSHPRIVAVRELTEAPLAFTMDYVDGPDLRSHYIDRSDFSEVLRIIYLIAETVRYAHSKGVRHRDIKPENVLIQLVEGGPVEPLLTDFDLAYIETNKTVTVQHVGGVIHYAAPEQFYSPNHDRAREATVDVYSLAQLMFFVIVGHDPSADKRSQNVAALSRELSEWGDDRSAAAIAELYSRSTELDPSKRPQSMDEVVSTLSKARAILTANEASGRVSADDFCRRVAFLYGGLNSFDQIDDGVSLRSNAGTTDIVIRQWGVASADSMSVRLSLSVAENVNIPGIKSAAAGRDKINQRLDKRLRNHPDVTRQPGDHGRFLTHLIVDRISLDVEGVARINDVLSAALGAMEEW